MKENELTPCQKNNCVRAKSIMKQLNCLFFSYICNTWLRLVVITSLINCALGFVAPTYFQLVLGAISLFNYLNKEELSMSKTITKAVGAVAVGPSESSRLIELV